METQSRCIPTTSQNHGRGFKAMIRRLLLSLLFMIAAGMFLLPDSSLKTSANNQWLAQNRQASRDGIWQVIDEVSTQSHLEGGATLLAYRAFQLNQKALTQVLAQAPMEFTRAAKTAQVEMSLPMPDGTFARFSIQESPIMAPELAAKFPEIKTYSGQGIDDPTATTRFDWMPGGFHAIIFTTEGTVYVDPASQSEPASYRSYYKHDYRRDIAVFKSRAVEAPAAEMRAQSRVAPNVLPVE